MIPAKAPFGDRIRTAALVLCLIAIGFAPQTLYANETTEAVDNRAVLVGIVRCRPEHRGQRVRRYRVSQSLEDLDRARLNLARFRVL